MTPASKHAIQLYEYSLNQDSLKEHQAAIAIKQLLILLLSLCQTHRRLGHHGDALG